MPTYTYTNLPSPSSGSVLMSNGTSNTLTWGNSVSINASPWIANASSGTYTITSDPNLKGASLQVKGNADFEGDVTIKGKSINESLKRIEERLAILYPNEELEKKWDKLRELRKQYMELEAEIIEKEKMWAILKK